jgi:hypothetical protein
LAHNRAVIGRSVWFLLGCLVLLACGSTPVTEPFATVSPFVAWPSSSPLSTGTMESMAPQTSTPVVPTSLVSVEGWGFTFDYPDDWRIIAEEVYAGIDTHWVVGTGTWDDGCTRSVSGEMSSISCTVPTLTAEPGEVVVDFAIQNHGPYIPIFDGPPFDSTILPNGTVANLSPNDATMAIFYAPGRYNLTMRATIGSPESEVDRAKLRAVVESVAFEAGEVRTSDESWDPPSVDSEECARLTIEGRLGNGLNPSLALLEPNYRFVSLIWPEGWFTRAADNGRGEVVSDDGSIVARQWDSMRIGGRGDHQTLHVCPDSVTVLRTFDPAPMV